MDPEAVDRIAIRIYRQFPEVAGAKPKVRKQPVPKGKKRPPNGNGNYLITFNGYGRTADGRNIPRWVRVVAKRDGRIVKITTSK